jgi:hypothetical protein
MDIAQQIREELGENWLPSIYYSRVRGQRTRSFEIDIDEKEHSPQIIETLLGVELQIGKLRTQCPDMGTARYLRAICRVGCRRFAVPYDITRLPAIADDLESAWEHFNEAFLAITLEEPPRQSGRRRSQLMRQMRDEIYQIGAGDQMPEFNRSTRQRAD